MKLLLDTGISPKHIDALQAAGHQVVWAGDPEDLGDAAILKQANVEDRVLVCLDKDFGELAIRQKQPHKGIIRLAGYTSAEHAGAIMEILDTLGDSLLKGLIVTAQKGKELRVRPPLRLV